MAQNTEFAVMSPEALYDWAQGEARKGELMMLRGPWNWYAANPTKEYEAVTVLQHSVYP